jgi:hypothetical protein
MDEDYGTEYDDSGDRTVSELEGVHSTLQEILSTIKSRTDLSGFFWLVLIILFVEGWSGSKLDRWTDGQIRCGIRSKTTPTLGALLSKRDLWTAISYMLH